MSQCVRTKSVVYSGKFLYNMEKRAKEIAALVQSLECQDLPSHMQLVQILSTVVQQCSQTSIKRENLNSEVAPTEREETNMLPKLFSWGVYKSAAIMNPNYSIDLARHRQTSP